MPSHPHVVYVEVDENRIRQQVDQAFRSRVDEDLVKLFKSCWRRPKLSEGVAEAADALGLARHPQFNEAVRVARNHAGWDSANLFADRALAALRGQR